MSTCDIDFADHYDTNDGDPCDFFVVVTITSARKTHRCLECRGEIAKGESYQRANYKFEGKLYSDARCQSCEEAATEFGYPMYDGCFWESMREQWAEGAHITACVQRLSTVRAKVLMVAQWRRWKDLDVEQAPNPPSEGAP